MRDHSKLQAFRLADNLALQIYKDTRCFPKDEQFGLTSQIRRATVSIGSNIVEGCARQTQADYLRFLHIAYGSAREVEYQLSLAFRLGYLNQRRYQNLNSLSKETNKVLNGLIRAMRN